MATDKKLGFSGSLAKRFQDSKITPLLALAGLLLGIFAVGVTPREEEPQINVTFANIFVPFPGASAVEVENLVAIPLEQVLSEIEGIKHTYSVSRPGMAVLTVQYKVGEDRTAAIVRLYNAVFSNQDWLPAGSGVMQPLIKPKKKGGNVPATSPESDALSKDLKKRGFRFVGSTIIYAHMQATGMVNDHVTGCFRHKPCAKMK